MTEPTTFLAIYMKKIRTSLFFSFAIMAVGLGICHLYFPDGAVRGGLVFGFLVGYFNLVSMGLLIGRLMGPSETKKKAGFAVLLGVKVLVLFGLIGFGAELLGLDVIAMAAGYLIVLFVVVTMNSLGYRSRGSNS